MNENIQRAYDDLAFWDSSDIDTLKVSEVMSNGDVIGYGGHAVIWLMVILTILVIGTVAYERLFGKSNRNIWGWINSHLFFFTAITWILGFLTYCVGTWPPGNDSFFSVVPMAIIHATGMFILDSDISAIHEAQHNSALFMFFFDISHFLAMLCSMIFILHHFGFLLVKLVIIKVHSWLIWKKDKNIFIFWGINKNSLLLAKNINDKHSEGSTIIFVRTHEDEESQSKQMGFKRIFDIVKMKDLELQQLRTLRCYVTSSFQRLSKVFVSDKETEHYILKESLKLKTLTWILNRATGTINFIMLGDDSDSNIKATLNLVKDATVKNKRANIYCHARKNAKNRFVEYYNLYNPESPNNIKVHLIDSAYLSIMELQSNVAYQPVSMIEHTKEATVESPFNALIIGFGGTGVEALRYLYEFSSFIKRDGTSTDFFCTIIDKDMDTLKGAFLEECPALKSDDGFDLKRLLTKKNPKNLNWVKAEVGTTEFWTSVTKSLGNVNCIFLTLNDDELQTNLMVQLFRKLCSLRTNEELKKVKIFVRVYDDASSRKISDFCQLVRKTNQEEGTVMDDFLGPEIVLFGIPKKMYTYENILDDKILKEAQRFNYEYQCVTQDTPDIQEKTPEEVWNDSFVNLDQVIKNIQMKNKEKGRKDTTNHMLVIQDIIRQVESNVCNSMHQKTKVALAGDIAKNYNFKRERGTTAYTRPVKNEETGNVEYKPISLEQETIFLNLARCEHERWIASHFLRGYQYGPTKDHRIKTHPDIRKWDDLDEGTKSYDCSVVDTTLRNINTYQSPDRFAG